MTTALVRRVARGRWHGAPLSAPARPERSPVRPLDDDQRETRTVTVAVAAAACAALYVYAAAPVTRRDLDPRVQGLPLDHSSRGGDGGPDARHSQAGRAHVVADADADAVTVEVRVRPGRAQRPRRAPPDAPPASRRVVDDSADDRDLYESDDEVADEDAGTDADARGLR